ncbi:hypothetical protein GCM10009628_02250 [Paeniglutamicibacter kerguelensis]
MCASAFVQRVMDANATLSQWTIWPTPLARLTTIGLPVTGSESAAQPKDVRDQFRSDDIRWWAAM